MFVKVNNSPYKDALFKEVEGLSVIRKQIEDSKNVFLEVPQVFGVNEQKLELENIKALSPSNTHQDMLGRGLAGFHKIRQAHYGFESDNYIGLNPQRNILSDNWGTFFVECRLAFQISLIENAVLRKQFEKDLGSIQVSLVDFLNQSCDYPSLLHGDLWSGNVMFSLEQGTETAWLIDPAVYYGDREVDIAMTEMFGGFSETFYRAYTEILPLSELYPLKKVIFNLYHTLNHYNLFGDAYLASCEAAMTTLKREFLS